MRIVRDGARSGIRPAAVAGSFYPDDPAALTDTVEALLEDAILEDKVVEESGLAALKALIAPHAGYAYSGPIAASAFAPVRAVADRIRRVVLLGPSHFVAVDGFALSGAEAFSTPLGEIPVDRRGEESIRGVPRVVDHERAHEREHSLEVELPFLQSVLGDFELVPVVVGEASPARVAAVLDLLWGGAETLIVVSSDLSHFYDYREAQRMDRATRDTIEPLDRFDIDARHACGFRSVNGLLLAAHQRGLRAETLDLRNSGDTAGPRDSVVGYGAWAFLDDREESP